MGCLCSSLSSAISRAAPAVPGLSANTTAPTDMTPIPGKEAPDRWDPDRWDPDRWDPEVLLRNFLNSAGMANIALFRGSSANNCSSSSSAPVVTDHPTPHLLATEVGSDAK